LVDFLGKSILDIGCGSGSFLKSVRSSAHEVLGIDPNPNNIEILREQGISGKVGYTNDFLNDIRGRFDIVTCFEVIEHLYEPWNVYTGAYEALVPGGVFVVTTPNAFHVLRGIDFLFRQKHRDVLMDPSRCDQPEHVRLWSAGMLVRSLRKIGFKEARCYGVVQVFNRVIVLRRSLFVRLFAQHLIGIGKK
jgi:2-polyprenyl-3-methyl-5-hydroxy-6-metoxy-1,4-benzoquinol methylase